MIWFLFVPFMGVLIFHSMFSDTIMYSGTILSFIVTLFFATFFTALTALPAAGAAGLCGFFFDSHRVETGRTPLIALRDKDGIAGTFFLGSGMIQNAPYYFFYRSMKDGGFKPDKVELAGGVRVYEEDRADALLIEYAWELNQEWAWIIAFPHSAGGYMAEFRVPKGTIRQGFSI